MKTIIFDIDGVLVTADKETVAAIKKKGSAWATDMTPEAFEKEHKLWYPVEQMVDMAKAYYALGYLIVLSTCRPERFRSITKDMMKKYVGFYNGLYMKQDYDIREDWEIKRDILVKIGKENIWFAIDDNEEVVNMYRREGIVCLRCRVD